MWHSHSNHNSPLFFQFPLQFPFLFPFPSPFPLLRKSTSFIIKEAMPSRTVPTPSRAASHQEAFYLNLQHPSPSHDGLTRNHWETNHLSLTTLTLGVVKWHFYVTASRPFHQTSSIQTEYGLLQSVASNIAWEQTHQRVVPSYNESLNRSIDLAEISRRSCRHSLKFPFESMIKYLHQQIRLP